MHQIASGWIISSQAFLSCPAVLRRVPISTASISIHPSTPELKWRKSMFDKKSEYALNKYDQDSIIYISVSGRIRLTRADFSSEEEFLKWKAWSDADYHQTEKEGRSFNDNRVALDDYLDVVGAVQSAEDEFFSELLKADVQAEEKALREKRLAALKAILNAKQYRRVWLYLAEKKSITEIARLEGVTKASISLSLDGAMKKISKKFAKALKNT